MATAQPEEIKNSQWLKDQAAQRVKGAADYAKAQTPGSGATPTVTVDTMGTKTPRSSGASWGGAQQPGVNPNLDPRSGSGLGQSQFKPVQPPEGMYQKPPAVSGGIPSAEPASFGQRFMQSGKNILTKGLWPAVGEVAGQYIANKTGHPELAPYAGAAGGVGLAAMAGGGPAALKAAQGAVGAWGGGDLGQNIGDYFGHGNAGRLIGSVAGGVAGFAHPYAAIPLGLYGAASLFDKQAYPSQPVTAAAPSQPSAAGPAGAAPGQPGLPAPPGAAGVQQGTDPASNPKGSWEVLGAPSDVADRMAEGQVWLKRTGGNTFPNAANLTGGGGPSYINTPSGELVRFGGGTTRLADGTIWSPELAAARREAANRGDWSAVNRSLGIQPPQQQRSASVGAAPAPQSILEQLYGPAQGGGDFIAKANMRHQLERAIEEMAGSGRGGGQVAQAYMSLLGQHRPGAQGQASDENQFALQEQRHQYALDLANQQHKANMEIEAFKSGLADKGQRGEYRFRPNYSEDGNQLPPDLIEIKNGRAYRMDIAPSPQEKAAAESKALGDIVKNMPKGGQEAVNALKKQGYRDDAILSFLQGMQQQQGAR